MIPEIDLTKPGRPAAFQFGDYVLYRDPDRFLTGQADHTLPARVSESFTTPIGMVAIKLLGCGTLTHVDPRFLRLIPAVDIMRDIDEAPLDDVAELLPAAVAWLGRQAKKRGES